MEHWWVFLFFHRTPRYCSTTPVCSTQFVFKWRAEKTWGPFATNINQSYIYCYNYYPSQQVHCFHSVFHSLPPSDWAFVPSMGPGAIVQHAFFLPKFCLRSSGPLRGPQSFSHVKLLCSPQKDLHLTLVSSRSKHTHIRTHLFFSSILSFIRYFRKKAWSECRCWTYLSSWLILSSLSFVLFLFPGSCGWSSCYITHRTPDALNLRVEVHHNSL